MTEVKPDWYELDTIKRASYAKQWLTGGMVYEAMELTRTPHRPCEKLFSQGLPVARLNYGVEPGNLKVRLENSDSLQSALNDMRQKELAGTNMDTYKVAVVSFAHNETAGGDALSGSSGQEESLCMRTSLWPTLLGPTTYNIESNALLYSRDVHCWGLDPIISDARDDIHAFNLDVISCAAPRDPPRFPDFRNGPQYRNDADRKLMLDKVTWILRAAVLKRVDTLVLGAFGCGKFKNPPHEVARIMRTVLFHPPDGDNWYGGGLKTVVLAIKDDNDPGKRSRNNFAIFRDVFSPEPNVTMPYSFDIVKTSLTPLGAYRLDREVEKELEAEMEMDVDEHDLDNPSPTATCQGVTSSPVSQVKQAEHDTHIDKEGGDDLGDD
jgi:uncharacterized protein (TIGR02452 family)